MSTDAATTTSDATASVLELVKTSRCLPVGFVGAGFSRRYLDTPDWWTLLEHLATLTGSSINRFLVDGDAVSSEKYPDIASNIATAFHPIWWDSDLFEDERSRLQREMNSVASPLKLQAAQYVGGFRLTTNPTLQEELAAFRESRFQSFVTTNYDTLLEDLRPDYACYESQDKALFSPTYEMGEIYKVHGSLTAFNSLVLTRSDYDEYERRNPYFTAKMLTYFVENPVIFFGYSLGDPHIQNLLSQLTQCLTKDQLETLNDRLIFVNRPSSRRPEELRSTPVTVPGHTFHAAEVGLSSWTPLFAGLADLPYHFAPRVLRRLRESVYSVARDSATTQAVRFVDIDDETAPNDLEIVLGVGVIDKLSNRGYGGLPIQDYLNNLLDGSMSLEARLLAEYSFDGFGSKYVPINYFLRLARAKGDTTDYLKQKKPAKWHHNETALDSYHTASKNLGKQLGSYANIQSSDALDYRKDDAALSDLPWSVEDLLLLREEIRRRLSDDEKIRTETMKLSCVFDRVVYGGKYEGDINELWECLGFNVALKPDKAEPSADEAGAE